LNEPPNPKLYDGYYYLFYILGSVYYGDLITLLKVLAMLSLKQSKSLFAKLGLIIVGRSLDLLQSSIWILFGLL